MAVDLSSIAPAELVRLLNSTRLGTVITGRQLYRRRQLGGMRIGDGDHIHLAKYARWLIREIQAREQAMSGKKTSNGSGKADDARQRQYARHRAEAAARQADIAEAGQEIGAPPGIAKRKRRAKCARNFRLFCETYFRPVFYLRWSKDHLRAVKKIERAVLADELFALAMPRGTGKSAMCRSAVLWAILYAHHGFVTLIGATDPKARKELAKIKAALQRNPALMEDFPEVCYPIRKLERSSQRANKQKSGGEFTNITWTTNEVVLPTIPDSRASGAAITACGLTGGEIRGQSETMPDGSIMRPSLVLLDDPQTKKSARSATQTSERLELLAGDVLGMAGPDRGIAGMMPCTVIEPGDMADQILDIDKHPEWHGERTKMVYAWPDNETLWEEYATRRADGLRRGDPAKATDFYRKNRAAMDAGSKVAWADRFPSDCISAIQHAMNLRLRDETAFFSEYQNEPLTEQAGDDLLTVEQIAEKLNRRKHAAIPTACDHLAVYIDVHKKLLYYVAVALTEDFTGYVVDYGTYPDQRKRHFTMRQARKTLLTARRGHGEEAAIYAGLEALTDEKLGKPWTRDDGAQIRPGLCLIDSGYQKDTVELFCKQSRYANVILPAKGLPVTASNIPLDERAAKKGEKIGDNWRVTGSQGQYSVRLVLLDTNYWKSFLHARLAVPIGDKGCLSLFGNSPAHHRLISEHFSAEYCVRTEGRGRKVDEWKLPPHKPDNHYFDAAVGCMAAGSMLGCRLLEMNLKRTRKKRKKTKRTAKYF